ncbi:TFIIB-type zinc ribbon-containing protein [Actinomadura harenae]|uniref:Zf-TFIIB domain containing protein n=1 Tax=Actinomadura harenae TaxID=2483351 RepID=A0A3M2LR50_9ACTN|nr:zf-TFIIB domain-containing protein [Actinomadura harenae]RMI39576.1 zf-TFIIB domain containing protein [Actinomadura harenae]
MHCPKCHGFMHTYNRNGIQIEQCANCRGVFLDYGELEALTRMEAGYHAAPPPHWGGHHDYHHGHHGHHGGLFHALFTS